MREAMSDTSSECVSRVRKTSFSPAGISWVLPCRCGAARWSGRCASSRARRAGTPVVVVKGRSAGGHEASGQVAGSAAVSRFSAGASAAGCVASRGRQRLRAAAHLVVDGQAQQPLRGVGAAVQRGFGGLGQGLGQFARRFRHQRYFWIKGWAARPRRIDCARCWMQGLGQRRGLPHLHRRMQGQPALRPLPCNDGPGSSSPPWCNAARACWRLTSWR